MATDIPVSRERELESGTPATPPKFDQTMQTAEVVEGSAARFDVTVTGSPVPKVRWLKDDKLLEENRKIRFDEDDDGVFSLFVNDVVVDDEGVYKCEATNVKGEVTCSAELIVEGQLPLMLFFAQLSKKTQETHIMSGLKVNTG